MAFCFLLRTVRVVVTVSAISAMLAPPAFCAESAKGTSSREVKDQARREIPWKHLSRNDQRVAQYVVRKASLYRRTPTHVFDCDPAVFNFLIRRPEVVVNVWNLMGVSKLTLDRTSDETFRAADNAGTKGSLRVAYSHTDEECNNKVVVLADGNYQVGPMPDAIRARCVLVLRSASHRETDGRTYVTARLDSFVRFNNVGTDVIAKTLRPLLAKSADHNFTETMKFVSTFSRTAEQRPEGLMNLAQRLDRVDPAAREELAELCRQSSTRRTAGISGEGPIKLVKLQSAAD